MVTTGTDPRRPGRTSCLTRPEPSSSPRCRRAVIGGRLGVTVVWLVAAGTLAACTPDIRHAERARASAPDSRLEQELADYASCLRHEGIRVRDARFDKAGHLARWLNLPRSPDVASVRQAADACQSRLPELAPDEQLPDPEFYAALEKFVDCMRAEGFRRMPDPTPQGLLIRGSGIDVDDARFRKADRKCERRHLKEFR